MAGAQAQARPRHAWLRFLGILAALAPAPAAAGAWIAPEGGQEVWTSVAGERDELSFYESSAYWEVPFADNASVVAAPWLEQSYETVDGWRGEAVVGVKRAVFRRGGTVMALQAGALWMSHPPLGCSEGGAELRWLGGRSFEHGDAFLNLEAGARALDGGCEGGRVDLSFGYRPAQNWLGMGQMFLDAPREGEETLRLQLSVVRFGEGGRGVQVGCAAASMAAPRKQRLC